MRIIPHIHRTLRGSVLVSPILTLRHDTQEQCRSGPAPSRSRPTGKPSSRRQVRRRVLAPSHPAEDFSGGTCSAAPPPRARKLEANEFTVHTRGNRQALEAQKRQRKDAPPGPQLRRQHRPRSSTRCSWDTCRCSRPSRWGSTGRSTSSSRQTGTSTSACRAASRRRTSSRPSVSATPSSSTASASRRARPDLLVSGGGDSDLFVWEWQGREARLESGSPAHVQSVAPEVARVAVSGLYACCWRTAAASEQLQVSIVVICDGSNPPPLPCPEEFWLANPVSSVPAVFFQLTEENALEHAQTVAEAGSPLDVGIVSNDAHPPRLVVAIDPGIPGGQVQGPENGPGPRTS